MRWHEWNNRGLCFRIMHPNRVLVLHYYLRRLAYLVLPLCVGTGLILAVTCYLHTRNSLYSALSLLCCVYALILFVIYLGWAERLYDEFAVPGLEGVSPLSRIYDEYLNLPEGQTRQDIDLYCAMIAYMDHRHASAVLYLSCFDRLLTLGEFRHSAARLRLTEDQNQQLIQELSRFVLTSRQFEHWSVVGHSN